MAEAYMRFMGRIRVDASAPQVQEKRYKMKINNVWETVTLKRTFNIASPDEPMLKLEKRKVMTVVREHLDEIKRAQECFCQFKSIINSEFSDLIDQFLRKTTSVADNLVKFKAYLDQLRHYQHLARQLPERIAFPLFEVGTS